MNEDKTVIFKFKTVQTNPIRILFESLKNILADVNFKVDSQGIKLTTVDGTQKAIINLILYGNKFEEYICKREINIGLNLISIFKILKGIKNTDTISFTVYEEDDSFIYLTTEHTDKRATITSRVRMLDLDEKIYNIPDIKFDSYITMPSSDFQGYISDLVTISTEIVLTANKEKFTMKASGDFAEQTISIKENGDSESKTGITNTGKFNIKFIQLFTKCTNLCGTVEIYLKTGYPFTIVYNVANLGQIKYCLAPNP